MTIQVIDGLPWIEYPPAIACTSSLDSMLLDAAGEKAAFIFTAPKSGDISHVGFRTSTVTTAQTLKVSLQGYDASGDPNGTILGATSNGFGTQAAPASNTFYEVALGESVTVTRGVKYAIVVEWDATVGSLQITRPFMDSASGSDGSSYSDHFTAAWAKTLTIPLLALKYTGGYVAGIMFPLSSITSAAFSSASTPDEIGNIISLPWPAQAIGIWCAADIDADATLKLYDPDGSTLLESVTAVSAARTAATSRISRWFFDTDVALAKTTNYRVTLLPGASSVGLTRATAPSAAMLGCWPCGTNVYLTTRTDAGAWTDSTDQRALMGLILNGFDDGAGAGAGGGPGPRILTPVGASHFQI